MFLYAFQSFQRARWFTWFQVLCKFWEFIWLTASTPTPGIVLSSEVFLFQALWMSLLHVQGVFSQRLKDRHVCISGAISLHMSLLVVIYFANSNQPHQPFWTRISVSPTQQDCWAMFGFRLPVSWFENGTRHEARTIVEFTSIVYLLSEITALHCCMTSKNFVSCIFSSFLVVNNEKVYLDLFTFSWKGSLSYRGDWQQGSPFISGQSALSPAEIRP